MSAKWGWVQGGKSELGALINRYVPPNIYDPPNIEPSKRMARDDVAHRVHAWIQRKNTQEVCTRKKRKRRRENTEYNHRIQMHDAHRHCTLPIKRRCTIISNMEIMSMKGGRISKYKNHL